MCRNQPIGRVRFHFYRTEIPQGGKSTCLNICWKPPEKNKRCPDQPEPPDPQARSATAHELNEASHAKPWNQRSAKMGRVKQSGWSLTSEQAHTSQAPSTHPTASTPGRAVQSTPPEVAQAPHCSRFTFKVRHVSARTTAGGGAGARGSEDGWDGANEGWGVVRNTGLPACRCTRSHEPIQRHCTRCGMPGNEIHER